jgi:Phytanoyl-CoA dioxygenase (PhyH)
MPLDTTQSLRPSATDLELYDEHGWWISPKLFSDEEIDAALEGAERHYAGHRDWTLPVAIKRYLDWTPDQGDQRLRMNDYIVLQNRTIGAIGLSPLIGQIAARLMRSKEARLFNSSLIYKPPQVEKDDIKVGWHTDRAYWQTSVSDRMLTAWIPLHDCPEEMGTITMIDGSHRWPSSPLVDELRAGRTFVSSDVDGLERRLDSLGLPLRKVPMELRKGQVSFHHPLTFHGSGVNRSDRPRVAVAVHIQDETNRYRKAYDAKKKLIVYNNDLLVRKLPNGEPDYSDPEICPVIWPSSEDAAGVR